MPVDLDVGTALIAGSAAVAAAAITAGTTWGIARSRRTAESERILSRYRDPVLRAAFDLQSRLYNILDGDFIETFMVRGNERERTYAIDNTLFLVAQYFAWNEIVRREVQFLDLGASRKTRALSERLEQIRFKWRTDKLGTAFRVFSGEQRAIGEGMTIDGPSGRECMGYAEFLSAAMRTRIAELAYLREDVLALADEKRLQAAAKRLQPLQNALIDLIDFLDPNCSRFPADREKYDPEAPNK